MSSEIGQGTAPSENDPYRDCETYLKHGACVCSTGYPASCTAEPPAPAEAQARRSWESAARFAAGEERCG